MPTTFGHVGIVAHDVDRLADFYTYSSAADRSGRAATSRGRRWSGAWA